MICYTFPVLLAHLWKNIGENIGCNLTKYRRNIGENYTSKVWSLVSHVIITLIPYIISHGFIWPNISQHSTQASQQEKKIQDRKIVKKSGHCSGQNLCSRLAFSRTNMGKKCKMDKKPYLYMADIGVALS